MNAVIGMTNLLLNTSLTAEQHEYTEIVRGSGETLLTIIDDILDFSKIEAGKLSIERQAFDLRECVESATDLLAGKAAEKGLGIAYQMDKDAPEAIEGDVTRVRQILVNLIANAIKFTERGEVVVSVTAIGIDAGSTSDTESDCEVHFAVTDTGIGIPADKVDRLFRSFSQVDASTTRRFGGTGLGLAISQRLSELMGGRMWVETEVGKGSTFHFTIRVRRAACATHYGYLHETQPALDGKRVLVVDDNHINRRILNLQTQSWGMVPRDTASPVEALQWIGAGEHFDVVLLDMHMPDMDGLELASRIRQEKAMKDTPLVLISSIGQVDGHVHAAELAATLVKPLKPSQLFNVLMAVFSGAQITSSESRPAGSEPLFDPEMGKQMPLRILLAEDNKTNQLVALRQLSQMGYRADVAGNGAEAVQALARQEYDVVLMDMQMPEMDGLEATRRIRASRPGDRKPRIIALTANAMEGNRDTCLESGMDDYVSKPIRPRDLIAALRRSYRSTQDLARQNQEEGSNE